MLPEIYPFLPSDLLLLKELQPPDWPDISLHFHYYTLSPYCFPIKVLLDQKMVGIGACIVRDETAWLAHIIVHPDYRQQGIGARITQYLVKDLQRMQKKTIYLIATDLGYPLYEKLGFRTETEYVFMKGGKFHSTANSCPYVFPFDASFRAQIMEIDRQVSGENRAVQLDEHLHNGFVYIRNKAIEGYYLPTWHEGLIIASTQEAGFELMGRRLETHETAALPVDNKQGIQFLLDHHFQEAKKAKRMRLGEKRNGRPDLVYNRISGSIG
jgi:GNAT superfamily N-acetyltransferase